MADETTVIALEKIGKTYDGGVEALRDANFVIQRGEAVSIMGKSGSGKSTLLSILGCLDSPSTGDYFFCGENVSHFDDNQLSAFRNLHIGFIFQTFYLIPQLNVVENVEVPLFYRGIKKQQRRAICLQYIEQVGLGHRAYHIPQKLSGGERQRVAIARALVNEPQVLLADEPTGSLDSKTGDEIMALLRELNQQRGATLILVTHDPKIGASLQRKIEISDGRIVGDIQCSIS